MKIAIPSIAEKSRQHHIELWQEQGALHEMEGRGGGAKKYSPGLRGFAHAYCTNGVVMQ